MSNLQIPPQCEGCPRLRGHIEHFDSHAADLADISAITPDMIENLRASIIDVLGYLGLSATQVNDSIPSVDDTRIGLIEEEINATNCMEEVQRSVEKYTDRCPGKLTMRAPSSDGVTYEATFCRSHENYVDGGQDIEPVAVRRYPS